MKEQEAIEFIKNKIQIDVRFCTDEDIENTKTALNIAINALEKQIPKRPRNTRREIVCPTCRTLVGSSPYCRYCGQMLDHSDHPTEKGGEEE